MRLDKFLKVTKVIKRRTVANEAASGGRIEVNGKVVAIHFGDKVSEFEILRIPEKVSSKEVGEWIKIL